MFYTLTVKNNAIYWAEISILKPDQMFSDIKFWY